MAELDIKERQAGDVTVLDMSGKVTARFAACSKRARKRFS